MDQLGLVNVDGRNPIAAHEISIGINTALQYGKESGDHITLFMYGNTYTFIITGIYQSVDNRGTGFRMPLSGIKKADPLYKHTSFHIILKDSSPAKVQAMIRSLEKKYGEAVDAQDYKEDIRKPINSVATYMAAGTLFVTFIFFLVVFISLFNITIIEIKEQNRDFGIYKTIGLTPTEIRFSLVIKVFIITVCAHFFGSVIQYVITPAIMQSLLKKIAGIASYHIPFYPVTFSISMIIILFISTFSSWTGSGQIKRLSSRNLIIE